MWTLTLQLQAGNDGYIHHKVTRDLSPAEWPIKMLRIKQYYVKAVGLLWCQTLMEQHRLRVFHNS